MNGNQVRSYADFELWIGPSAAGRHEYPVQVVASPDGYGDGLMALDIDTDEFQAKLVRVCSRESNFPLRQEFGKALFNALFTGDVRDRWKGSIGRVRGSPTPIGLRLLLRIQDARLALLPWELLYDQQAGGFLGATANQTVSRLLPMAEPEDFRAPEKLRVLLVIQSPPPGASDKLRPIPPEEIAGLELAKARLSPLGVEFTVLENPSMAAIFEELQRQEYHVLHYLGHGSPGELYLVAEAGRPFTAVDDVAFSYWFAGRKSLRLIVLNACASSQVDGAGLFSGIGPASVSIGVPAVIAMQYDAVYTDTASLFSERFYVGLAAGRPVDVAVNEARQFLSSKYQAARDWSTPVLYMGTRSGRILTLPASAQEQGIAQMAQALAKVTAALADLGHHHAELDLRANRLREWLDVQRNLLSARSNIDQLSDDIRLATRARPEQVWDRRDAVVDTWDTHCQQDMSALKTKIRGLRFVVVPGPDGGAAASASSVAGWLDALDTLHQTLQATFSGQMPGAAEDRLPSIFATLDAQCRPLRDWLRDRDNECRNRLEEESKELARQTDLLCRPAKASDMITAAPGSPPGAP